MATANKNGSTLRRVLSILAAVFIGGMVGAGIYGVAYAELPSYLGSDPLTCANCHVMQDYYDAWSHGQHANVATCSDCHLPNTGFIANMAVKAEDGVLHSLAFTSGNYPTNIVIRDRSLTVVNTACLSCHDLMTSDIRGNVVESDTSRTTVTCTRCHSTTGHN
ncbi:MAG: cytochrome c nitrite reductase small subunit [Propionibacteriaceae bacterium]|jgi:cytochrome c nitrite reductase small subunit|nr:cytochrome c nitrite reductase small subunit [Propionibacteriaceae bacterium]